MIAITPEQRIKEITITKAMRLIDALRIMDKKSVKLLLVMEDRVFCGLLSIGDIQRAIIRQVPLEVPVEQVLRQDFLIAREDESFEAIRGRMLEYRTEFMPVVNAAGDLVRVLFWDDVFSESRLESDRSLRIPVVVMAGGMGSRLRPITNVIPKPLIPLGEKTIIEEIMDRFYACGVEEFHVSVNYKGEMIQRYLEEANKPYQCTCYWEDRPMGTVGSLQYLRKTLKNTFFVSNCDIVVDYDYREIYRYHCEEENDITAVAALKLHSVPYGVFECDASGKMTGLREKPDIQLLVNVGLYILEPHLLEEIPDGGPMDITQLIEKVRLKGGRVGVFPISEQNWFDVGGWTKYFKVLSQLHCGPSDMSPVGSFPEVKHGSELGRSLHE